MCIRTYLSITHMCYVLCRYVTGSVIAAFFSSLLVFLAAAAASLFGPS